MKKKIKAQKQIKLSTSKYKPIVPVVGPHNWFVFILPKIVKKNS